MYTEEERSHFMKKLQSEKDRLLRDIRELETPPDFENEPGMEDETEESEEMFNNQATANSYRSQLAEVEAAMLRIEKGTYGICEKTGREIPKDALEVSPTLRFHPDYLKQSNTS